MLKKIRITLSIILFSLITFYFLDFTELMPNKFHVLAHIQLIPAILGGSIIILASLVVMTLFFGRIYCSSVCPMGVFQDIVSWISKRTGKKKKRYSFSKAKTILRWSALGVAVVGFIFGFSVLTGLIEPYSAYGRMASNIFRPVYMEGNNLLESIFSRFDNYTFYKTEIFINSVFALIISLLTFVIIGFLAWKYGRTYCNTICPVGTILGFLSKFSLLKIRINSHKCNACGLCESKCKASCIDTHNKEIVTVDYSRCVDCFNCLGSCKRNAIAFSLSARKEKIIKVGEEQTDEGKRRFLLAGIATAIAIPATWAQKNAGSVLNGVIRKRKTPITPPGSISAEHLLQHCTSCHLCVSKCPSRVLKPAFMEYGIGGMMQPMMYFEKGFCNYDCTVCSEVCPTSAIQPLTKEQKHLTQVGRVVFDQSICVVQTEGTNCGACAEHCPTQAVTMVPYKEGLTIPHINPDICVGCGGCEFICPVRPNRAIYVEGNAVQQQAQAFKVEKKQDVEIDDFGF